MPAFTSFVVAGGGNLGGPLTRALLKQGFKVSVTTRSKMSVNARSLAKDGATIHEVDYSDPSSIAKGLAGSEVVINTLGFDGQDRLIEQAKKTGAKLYIPNDFGLDYQFVEQKGIKHHLMLQGGVHVADELKKLGLPYLRIYNGCFGSYLGQLFSVDKKARTAKIYGAGTTPFTATAEQDVAQFVAQAFAKLPRQELENATLRVSAAHRFTANELFEQVEKRDGHSWTIERAPLEQAKKEAYDESLGYGGFFSWCQFANESGASDHPSDNERVGFEPSIDLVDLLLGKPNA